MLEVIAEIVGLIDEAQVIFESDADWEIKYDAIFGLKIHQKIKDEGFTLHWYDPDTSYEEDVRAYWSALVQFKEKLGNLVVT